MDELTLDGFPPISPHLPAVRSLAHIPSAAKARDAFLITQQQSKPTSVLPEASNEQPLEVPTPNNAAPRIKVLANLTGADLLPVSPFLLSPTEPGLPVDSSRSPFFTQRPKQAPSEGNASAVGKSPLGSSPAAGLTRSASHNQIHHSGSTPSAMDQLASDLAKAQSDLATVRREYAQLRDLAAQVLPSVSIPAYEDPASLSTNLQRSNQVAREAQSPPDDMVAGPSKPRSHLRLPEDGSPSHPDGQLETPDVEAAHDLGKMSGEEAKQKLKVSVYLLSITKQTYPHCRYILFLCY